jgi:hypothetical protein
MGSTNLLRRTKLQGETQQKNYAENMQKSHGFLLCSLFVRDQFFSSFFCDFLGMNL